MTPPLPIVLVPGLCCTARFYTAQIPALWPFGPVTIASHTSDDSIAAIAARILATAPPQFALAGHSLGGYLALEIVRQAHDRVVKLALLDTSARADVPEQTQRRRMLMGLATRGRFDEVSALLYPGYVHPARLDDEPLRRDVVEMARACGPDVFVRQQTAIIARIDQRPYLADIKCPALVLVGDSDQATPPERATEIAAGIADARLVVVADSGHMTAMEQPDAVTRAMVEWLAA